MEHLNRESQCLSDKDKLADVVVNLSKVVVVVDAGLDIEELQELLGKVLQLNHEREVDVVLNGKICRKLKSLTKQNLCTFIGQEIIREEIKDCDEAKTSDITKAFYKAINRTSDEIQGQYPKLVLFLCNQDISYFNKDDTRLTTMALEKSINNFFMFVGIGNEKFKNLRKLVLKCQNTGFMKSFDVKSSEMFTTDVLEAYVPWLKANGYIS